MKVANAVAQILKKEGVEFLIGYPVNQIIEAAAEADIRTIIVRQERTGLHMADAVSRVTSADKIGVFAMQHGPGAENAFGGVAQAYGDSVPIVVLPGGYPRRLTNIQPNFNSFLNYHRVTKWSEQVIVADAAPEAMRRAFTQVKNGRPRPVLVEFPVDVLREEIGDFDYTPAPRTRVGPDPRDVSRVAEALVAAQRPVIYAGQGVHYGMAWKELRELAELLEAPVTTSLQGKSAFPENHPLSLGSGGRSISQQLHHFLQSADLIFGIGCSFATTNYGVAMPKGKRIAHATLDPTDINKDIPADLALVGDAAQLHRLGQDHAARLRPRPRDGRQARRAGQALRQRLGRRRDRLHRDGLRDGRAGADPHPLRAAQQLLDGHRAEGHEGGHRQVSLDRHQRRLRRDGPRLRRPRRAGNPTRRDRAGHPPRDQQDPGGHARAPGIHHREG